MLKKLVFYTLIAIGIAFLVNSPHEAARLVKVTGESAGEFLSAAADAFGKFVSSLV